MNKAQKVTAAMMIMIVACVTIAALIIWHSWLECNTTVNIEERTILQQPIVHKHYPTTVYNYTVDFGGSQECIRVDDVIRCWT